MVTISNEELTTEGLAKVFSTVPRFTSLKVLDFFFRGVDEFNSQDAVNLAAELAKSHLQDLTRFSISLLKTQIDDTGLRAVFAELSKLPKIADVHINVGQAQNVTGESVKVLTDFLDATTKTLKAFDVSTMWYASGLTQGAEDPRRGQKAVQG